jgi:hypothetical protein
MALGNWRRKGLLAWAVPVLAGLWVFESRCPAAAPPMGRSSPVRVGNIIIIGNQLTPRSVILDQVPLYPGQVLTEAALHSSERNLARLGIFVVPRKGGRRTVCQIEGPDPDCRYRDILVTVQEVPLPPLAWEVAEAAEKVSRWRVGGILSAVVPEPPGRLAVGLVAVQGLCWRVLGPLASQLLAIVGAAEEHPGTVSSTR